ncbi:hypothetical protein [Pseudoflavitalea rhizosphaerae]|uniref:hypothetical protein n=1 Tax=Pseudoflavitalea rhizosphaerae TaxID=1884793 RepID=UPI000F8C65FB|nr:hypothetical protein [Pseudoflavitalea rhizosphaerae]
MKKLILPFLSLSLFISACSKDDDKDPKEIIQLQEVEMEDSKLSFTYNEQSQPTKIQFSMKVNDEAYLPMYYLDFTYNNGKPATADFFIRPQINEGYRRQTSAKFVHEGGNLSYTALLGYDENGTPDEDRRDTLFYTFNAANRLTSLKAGSNGAAISLGWDGRNNLLVPPHTQETSGERITSSFEHGYDNNTNPYSLNGLGFLLIILNLSQVEMPDQLLSPNNGLSYKQTIKRETLDNGQVVGEPAYDYTTITRTITLGEKGLPATIELKEKKTTSSGSEENQTRNYKFKYSIIKQ